MKRSRSRVEQTEQKIPGAALAAEIKAQPSERLPRVLASLQQTSRAGLSKKLPTQMHQLITEFAARL